MTEETIFAEALEKSTSNDRTAYLDKACADDTVLRQRIETLLKSHEADGDFLGKPAIQCAAEDLAGQAGQACAGDPQGELPADDGGVEALDFLAPSDKPGSLGRLGHYEVLEVIGRGGMGIVLRAFDEKLHRMVAIKVMAAQLATNATARKRFTREAQAAAAVTHDHIVTIHAVEEANGLPYLVMQYVSGMSLQQRLDRNGPLELREIVRIGMQTAAGLAAAHAQGLIHRDIKPANILLENGVERVKVTDFGLARAVADASLTQSGVVAGTPQYMSPEQARGEAVDQRTDLFSLGSVLYAMCAGRPPFRAATGIAVLKRVCEDTPSAIRETNPEIPEWLVEIVTKLHAKDPADRFQSAAEVAELLSRHLAHLQHPSIVGPVAGNLPSPSGRGAGGEGAPRRRRWAMAAAALLLCLVAGLGFTEATSVTNLRATVTRIFTPEGTLIVETDDPDVEVTVKQDGEVEQIVDKKSGRTVTLKAGRYRLELDNGANGLTLSTDQFTLERGGKEVVRVRLGPPVITEVRRFDGAPEGATYMAAFCPGDKYVLTGGGSLFKDGNWAQGRDFALRLWDRATGKELHRLEGHTDAVLGLGTSPDGKRTVSGGGGGSKEPDFAVRVWDLENRKELRRFTKHTGRVISLAFLPNGKQVVSVGGRSEVWLWDVESGEEVRQFKGHDHEVRWVAVLPDGKRFITAGQDGLAFLWDVATGKSVRPLANGEAGGGGALTPDGRHVALSCSDNTIRLFEVETGNEVRRFTGQKGWTAGMAFSPDGRRLLSGSEGKTIHLWDVATGKEVCRFDGGFQGPAGVAGITADGKEALVNCWDGSLRLLRLPPVPPADKKK